MYEEHQECLSFLSTLHPSPLMAPGSKNKLFSSNGIILQVDVPESKQKSKKDKRNLIHYLLYHNINFV